MEHRLVLTNNFCAIVIFLCIFFASFDKLNSLSQDTFNSNGLIKKVCNIKTSAREIVLDSVLFVDVVL